MQKSKNSYFISWIIILHFAFCILHLIGCAVAPVKKPNTGIPQLPGTWHQVERGQTLWKISKAYGIDLEELARINQISDTRRIDMGQLIFIPYAKEPKKIIIVDKVDKEEGFIWPVEGKVVLFFGDKKEGYLNKGIDIQPKHINKTAVLASSSGTVKYCADLKGYGKIVIIDHGNGFSTVYTNNSDINISLNDFVMQGTQIANTDTAGRGLLHFEIRKNNRPLNPLYFLP